MWRSTRLRARGWSVSAIARHTGRDRKTVRKYLAGAAAAPRAGGELSWSRFASTWTRGSSTTRTSTRRCSSRAGRAGFDRSYVTFVRQLRLLGLRPRCEACRTGGHGADRRARARPGEEIQLDWLELPETPWGEPAYVLVGALSLSGRFRGGDQRGHDVRAPRRRDRRRLAPPGRHAAGVAHRPDGDRRGPGHRSDHGRSSRSPPSTTASRSGSARRGGRSARASSRGDPVRDQVVVADRAGRRRWAGAGDPGPVGVAVADRRKRRGEHDRRARRQQSRCWRCRRRAFPAQLEVERRSSRSALVAFEGNHYSVPPGLVGQTVTVTARVGELHLRILSAAGGWSRTHRRAPAGAGQPLRSRRARRAARASGPGCVHDRQAVPAQGQPAARRAALAEPRGCAATTSRRGRRSISRTTRRCARSPRERARHAYQQLRAAPRLPQARGRRRAARRRARAGGEDKPGYTQFLHDLLDVEVAANAAAPARTAGCGSPAPLPQDARGVRLQPRSPAWIAASSRSSRRCGSSRRRPTCCPSGRPASARRCSRSRSASRPSTPATASTTPPPPTSSPAPPRRAEGPLADTRCASGTARSC